MKRPVILSLSVLPARSSPARRTLLPSPRRPRPTRWSRFARWGSRSCGSRSSGGYFGLDRSGEENLSGGGAFVGVYKDLMPSIVGIGASGEAYLGGYSGLAGVNGGVRALAELRSLLLKVGVDYDLQREDASFILSLTVPLRRGGILGHGTQLRVDWLPGRGNSWNFGLQVPLEPHMGKTRFRDTEVDMPRAKAPARPPVDPAVAAAMREAHASARAIAVLSSAFWPDERTDRQKSLAQSRERILEFKRLIGQASALRPQGVRMETEVRILHDQVDRAFGLATGATGAEAGPAGARLGALAREVVLDEVLYPYNRLLGQFKRPEELWGLAAKARERFAAKLDEAGAPAGRRDAVLAVFAEYLSVVEETRAWWVKQLKTDSRLAWLPFQLALRPEQHDSQAELDAILANAQGTPLVGRQRRALPARPAVPGRAAAHDPRRRGLPRPLAARLRRRRPRGRSRRDRVLHQRRGLPRRR